MYIYTYIYIYVRIYTYIYIQIHIYTHLCLDLYTYRYAYTHLHNVLLNSLESLLNTLEPNCRARRREVSRHGVGLRLDHGEHSLL